MTRRQILFLTKGVFVLTIVASLRDHEGLTGSKCFRSFLFPLVCLFLLQLQL